MAYVATSYICTASYIAKWLPWYIILYSYITRIALHLNSLLMNYNYYR